LAAPLDPSLKDAFQATAYELQLEGQILALRIGAPSPALDALLDARGASSVTCLSAHNPDAQPASPQANAAALAALWREIEGQGWQAVRHIGRPDRGDWPPEEGAAIFDLSLTEAHVLARFGRQLAFVTYQRGGALTLVMTEIQRTLD
jgi:hypothetical protein